jgi:methylenetetrahydrofolate--tRNA-(uracil-5-)-methyltransferase
VNAPLRLGPSLELKARKGLYLAGQMAGVEGYVESAALGGLAGTHAARVARGLPPAQPPPETAHGALLTHLGNASSRNFQPMNVNFGLFPPLDRPPGPGRPRKQPKRERYEAMAERGLRAIERYRSAVALERP